MESGTVVRWLKQEGERVEKGEPLYELDTEKVTQEVEAEASGVLLKIAVQEGEVPVGQTVAVIGEEGEDVPQAEEAEVDETPQEEGSRAPERDAERRGRRRRFRCARDVRAGDRDQGAGSGRACQGVAARPPDRARARDRARAAARHGARGPNRRRGRGAGRDRAGRSAGGGACRTSAGRGRGRAADVDPQDDRAPPDRGLAGAGLPDLDVGGDEPGGRAPRAARRAGEGRPQADDL